MWRNEQQTNDAIFLLLDNCGLPALQGLWMREGPTDRALELFEANGGYLSGGERRMLLIAFDLAGRVYSDDHERKPSLSDVTTLDWPRARLCLGLVLAMAESMSAIDKWIQEQCGG